MKIVTVLLSRMLNCCYPVPSWVRGMEKFDKSLFQTEVSVAAVKFSLQEFPNFMPVLQPYVHPRTVPKLKCIESVENSKKLVLLEKKESLPEIKEKLSSRFNKEKLDSSIEFLEHHPLFLGFDNWSLGQILEGILPENLPKVRGFSQMGHIAHLNLRDEHTPFKKIIGQVVLEKVKSCRTVVNKMEKIEYKFRNFQLELLAGDPDYITTVKHGGFTFRFDFSKVFWNSKLGEEHRRLVATFAPNSVVYDVFAGVGPFAIRAAKKPRSCTVIANDLNPECTKFLRENAALNKVSLHSVHTLDGAEFIRTVLAGDLQRRIQTGLDSEVHIIMNLPASAVTFLPSFMEMLKCEKGRTRISANIWVHCYLFSKENEFLEDARKQVNESFESAGVQSEDRCNYFEIKEAVLVRNVAPSKEMICVSVVLKDDLLYGNKESEQSKTESDDVEPNLKRIRT